MSSGEENPRKRFADRSAESPRVKLTTEEQKNLDELVALGKNSTAVAAASAIALKPIDPGDAKALPKLHLQLIGVAALTCLLQFLMTKASPGLGRDLWIHLPMQLYWTYCLYRLSQVMGRRYGDQPPLSDLELAALSVVSFVCMPGFDLYHFAPRWLDPFFWFWAATQFMWTFKIGVYLEQKENPGRRFAWRLPAALTLGTNAYILFGLFNPVALSIPIFFNSLWFISQFWCILFLTLKLQGKFDDRKATASESRDRAIVSAGSDIVIRYRPFIAIERWIKERFSQKGMKKGAKFLFMWFVAPFMLLASLIGLTLFVSTLDPIIGAGATAVTGAAAAAAKAANVSFMTVFLSTLAGLSGLGTLVYMRQPTHIGFGADGLRFLWRQRFFQSDGAYTPWEEIVRIAVVRPDGKTSPLDDRLCFASSDGKRVEIKMGSIDSVEDRESVLKAIRKWAPTISRDSSVEQALQPPADYSYTELWLQALSAPPKRERLQPLLSGVVLRDGRYKVLQTLGTGGQGQAYLAPDGQSGQTIVLKEFILPVYVDVNVRRTALEQFENEARILRQLDHPQIVKMVDFFIEDHRAYLVLEHIHGASLREIVKNRRRLPEKQVRMLASQMCDILVYLHGLAPPVVHRDFTPDNLILNVDGTLKLIDFNVAKQEVESTTSGTVVGKHAYLPPEQFRGMPETQSDIYALGATLFFLLTGSDPEPIAVSHPKQVCPDVSASLNAAVEHATALDLAKRYQHISELKADLSGLSVD